MPTHVGCHGKHELSLTTYKSRYMCDGCKMDGYGERYRCTKLLCDHDLHKECMNPTPTRTLLGSTVEFIDQPPRRPCNCRKAGCRGIVRACNVCGMTVEGFHYHRQEGGSLDAHPLCAILQPMIRVDDVEFELRQGVESRCNLCKKRKLKGSVDKIPGFCYVSGCGEYSYHVYCLMAMGMEYESSMSTSSVGNSYGYENDDEGRSRVWQQPGELALPELRLQRNVNPCRGGGRTKFVKVVKLFLKIVLSVLFGDPTAIIASVVVELLPS